MPVSPALREAQRAGFPLAGESSIALDLVDTVLHAHASDSTDLLDRARGTWWALQSPRLPEDVEPSADDTARLRAALRELIESRIDDEVPAHASIDHVNRYAASAASIPELRMGTDGLSIETIWSRRGKGNARLAAIACAGIELVTDPDLSPLLRRCANPTCSMLFLAENPRRVWCAPNVCGNRMRVARHQRRARAID